MSHETMGFDGYDLGLSRPSEIAIRALEASKPPKGGELRPGNKSGFRKTESLIHGGFPWRSSPVAHFGNGVAKPGGCKNGSWGAEGASSASVAVWQCATFLGSWHLHKRDGPAGCRDPV